MSSPASVGRVPDFLCRMSDDELRQFARRTADENGRRAHSSDDSRNSLAVLARRAAGLGVKPPTVADRHGDDEEEKVAACIARLENEKWWRRALRAAIARDLERRARDGGRVQRHAGIYISDQGLRRRRAQRQRTGELLAFMDAVNELGDSFTVAKLRDASVSNPRIRRSELMARISGFETIAQELGHVAEFYTVSCPSRMHCRRSKSGQPVAQYDGTQPDQTQRYLRGQWQKVRAALHRQGACVYGIRVVEPHHDGTPHWHLLLFMPPEDRHVVRETLAHYAFEVDGDEPGARRHRFQVEPIDPAKGSAVGYVAKYISKNIDGYRLDSDLHGTAAEEAAERIEAWATTWGIRQFQTIGGPPVSVWRELRRADEAPAGILDEARRAADAGDWAEFVRLMRGPGVSRCEHPVRLAKAWSDEPGQYGEPKGNMTFGVEAEGATLVTRIHEWTIECVAGGGRGREGRRAPAAAPPPEFIAGSGTRSR